MHGYVLKNQVWWNFLFQFSVIFFKNFWPEKSEKNFVFILYDEWKEKKGILLSLMLERRNVLVLLKVFSFESSTAVALI